MPHLGGSTRARCESVEMPQRGLQHCVPLWQCHTNQERAVPEPPRKQAPVAHCLGYKVCRMQVQQSPHLHQEVLVRGGVQRSGQLLLLLYATKPCASCLGFKVCRLQVQQPPHLHQEVLVRGGVQRSGQLLLLLYATKPCASCLGFKVSCTEEVTVSPAPGSARPWRR